MSDKPLFILVDGVFIPISGISSVGYDDKRTEQGQKIPNGLWIHYAMDARTITAYISGDDADKLYNYLKTHSVTVEEL